MASRYLPPYLRNRKDTGKIGPIVEEVKPVEDSFPTLSNVTNIQVVKQSSGKSFASMASDWAKDSEKQKEEEGLRMRYRETTNDSHKHPVVTLPRFHNVRHFVEPEDDEEQFNAPVANNDAEGWTEVRHKKYRRQKTFEEKLAEDELKQNEESKDETVWNTEDDESYWKH